MELLQIATGQFITKCDGQLLEIATAFLLQSETRFITSCDRYYKVPDGFITNCDRYYKLKCDDYYKLRRYTPQISMCN